MKANESQAETAEINEEAAATGASEQEASATYDRVAEDVSGKIQADEAEERQDPAEAQLKELRAQAEENYQKYLRTQADFDNFRRRSRQEKEDFAKYASMKLIGQLLPVLDNIERALASSKENKDSDALIKGVEMTFRQLDQVLVQEGLKPMETVGLPFNPEYHQAIAQVESEEHEEGVVVEELQKGYMLKDKVLRPAMVKVSN